MAAGATATGTLETTPMSQLLVYALDKRLTGSFVFQTHDGKRSALYVERGAPVKAKTAEPVSYLGRILLEQNKIDENTYNATLGRVAKEKRLHGELLLEQGVISRDDLDGALAEQLLRQIVWLFSLPLRTAYGFYDGQNYLERWGAEGAKVEPLALLWRGIRSHENIKRIDATLARLGPRPLRLHAQAQPGRFRFAPADLPVVEIMRAKPQLLRDLLGAGVADVPTTKRIVYALILARHVDFGVEPLGVDAPPLQPGAAMPAPPRQPAAGRPPLIQPPPLRPLQRGTPLGSSPSASAAPLGSSPSASAAPLGSSPTASHTPAQSSGIVPTHESPEVAAFRKELAERLEKMPTQNYYEILGVGLKDDGPAISAAFFQLAKRWHPDRLGPEYAHVRDDAMTLFARMTQAHQVLSDPDHKKEYDEVVKDGGGTAEEQEQVQKVMRAVVAYQKAQVLFKKQNLDEAGKLAKQAMDDDPEQAEYAALWVQIECQDPLRAKNNNYGDLIKLMDGAVKKERDNEKVRFARGVVLKKAGRSDEAMKDFRWVARHDPHNLDAIREVRLNAMRSGTDPGGKGKDKGGMFGKLFKK